MSDKEPNNKEISDEDVTIEFPCDYPIKIIGESSAGFREEVVAIVLKFDDSVTTDKVSENNSSGGKYQSIRIQLWATGKPQLQDLFDALKDHPSVRMVL